MPKVTDEQKALLIEYMEKNPDLVAASFSAKYTARHMKGFLKGIGNQLNAPPVSRKTRKSRRKKDRENVDSLPTAQREVVDQPTVSPVRQHSPSSAPSAPSSHIKTEPLICEEFSSTGEPPMEIMEDELIFPNMPFSEAASLSHSNPHCPPVSDNSGVADGLSTDPQDGTLSDAKAQLIIMQECLEMQKVQYAFHVAQANLHRSLRLIEEEKRGDRNTELKATLKLILEGIWVKKSEGIL